ncbi:hypothetical protein NQ315_002869 [Exocentrus adspersus]|uniref:DNA-directed DNA polymerase n=1 Tax=Exocentrus adspersus TaxID=1586481 RepID=A0AAV8VFF3_9CUCU|nr:hypothetical protein NQ315_002869 [Exocentrus adspersus]
MHGSGGQEGTVKLINHWKNIKQKQGAESLISKPNFHSLTIFNENLVAMQMNKLKCTFNKPIYVGFTVLDISKTTMYDFHYNFIKKTYSAQAKLLYTDTDSLVYNIQTEDFYDDMIKHLDKFDMRNYDVRNTYNVPLVNKAVLGVFKDENSGNVMLEFVGVRAKLYDFVVRMAYSVVKKAKGVKKCVK